MTFTPLLVYRTKLKQIEMKFEVKTEKYILIGVSVFLLASIQTTQKLRKP